MMKKRKLKLYCLLMTVICLGLFSRSTVLADTAGLGVDTSVVMLRMESGKDLQFSFNAKNQTKVEQLIHLEEKDITIGDENIVTFVEAAGGPSSWVVFEENDFVLEPGQTKKIEATLKIPKEQKAGAQLMTIISFASKDALPLEGPKVSGNIGVYTLLSNGEAQNASGKIESLTYAKFVHNSTTVNVVYSNTGDVQFVPQGRVSIANLFTKKRSEISFDNHFVFPGKKVTFTKNLAGLSSFGAYELKISFKDGNGQLLENSGYVIGEFFPIVLVLVVILLLFFGVILMRIRRRNSKENRTHALFGKKK